ncbi:hypothetical protein B0H14DRAFT_3479959 [Mycena olivaceomarginata]|nr:hypothetical protein B0H14DRAFT_3479959 [Mycena olivaceomarginata]
MPKKEHVGGQQATESVGSFGIMVENRSRFNLPPGAYPASGAIKDEDRFLKPFPNPPALLNPPVPALPTGSTASLPTSTIPISLSSLYGRLTRTNAVYPNGVGGAWSGASYLPLPEDLQLVSNLLDEIRAGWCVDNSRIYATGCVSFLLCFMFVPPSHLSSLPPPAPPHISPRLFLNPDSELRRANHTIPSLPSAAASSTPSPAPPVGRNFAAFAAGLGSFLLRRPRWRLGAVVNSRTSQPCTPARSPLPVLEIHGGSDTLSWWAAHNGCTAANTTETPFDRDVHHSSWACAEGESVLQH